MTKERTTTGKLFQHNQRQTVAMEDDPTIASSHHNHHQTALASSSSSCSSLFFVSSFKSSSSSSCKYSIAFLVRFLFVIAAAICCCCSLADAAPPYTIRGLRLTNDSYTGYISENLALAEPESTTPVSPGAGEARRAFRGANQTSQAAADSMYLRFVDQVKPAVRFRLAGADPTAAADEDVCRTVIFNDAYDDYLNVRVDLAAEVDVPSNSDEEARSAAGLFELDNEAAFSACDRVYDQYDAEEDEEGVHCLCYLKLRLRNGEQSRDRINREAKDLYAFQLSLRGNNASTLTGASSSSSSSAARVEVHVLDDNDLEPMFDPSEYFFTLSELGEDGERAAVPAFSTIGRVIARDPDLGKNGQVRYYINCVEPSLMMSSTTPAYDQATSASSSTLLLNQEVHFIGKNCHKYFGISWASGDVYLKRPLAALFADMPAESAELEIVFEVKAIDTGVKMQLANSLLSQLALQRSKPLRRGGAGGKPRSRKMAAKAGREDVEIIKQAASNFDGAASKPQMSATFSSLEVALVHVRLVRAQGRQRVHQFIARDSAEFVRLDEVFSDDESDHQSAALAEQIGFGLAGRPNRVAFGLVKFAPASKQVELAAADLQVRVNSSEPGALDLSRDVLNFRLVRLHLNTKKSVYLVFFDFRANSSALTSYLAATDARRRYNLTVSYCEPRAGECLPVVETELDLGADLLGSIARVSCPLRFAAAAGQEQSVELDELAPAGSVLGQFGARLSNRFDSRQPNLCQVYLGSRFDVFSVEYRLGGAASLVHVVRGANETSRQLPISIAVLDEYFKLNRTSGQLRLAKSIDFESVFGVLLASAGPRPLSNDERFLLNLTVEASAVAFGKRVAETTQSVLVLLIDANDNKPVVFGPAFATASRNRLASIFKISAFKYKNQKSFVQAKLTLSLGSAFDRSSNVLYKIDVLDLDLASVNRLTTFKLIYCLSNSQRDDVPGAAALADAGHSACPFELDELDGTLRLAMNTSAFIAREYRQINSLIRISDNGDWPAPLFNYVQLTIEFESTQGAADASAASLGPLKFESQNCSYNLRFNLKLKDLRHLGSGARPATLDAPLELGQLRVLALNGSRIDSACLFTKPSSGNKAAYLNESCATNRFALHDEEETSDEGCFEIDPMTGRVYFKCKWPQSVVNRHLNKSFFKLYHASAGKQLLERQLESKLNKLGLQRFFTATYTDAATRETASTRLTFNYLFSLFYDLNNLTRLAYPAPVVASKPFDCAESAGSTSFEQAMFYEESTEEDLFNSKFNLNFYENLIGKDRQRVLAASTSPTTSAMTTPAGVITVNVVHETPHKDDSFYRTRLLSAGFVLIKRKAVSSALATAGIKFDRGFCDLSVEGAEFIDAANATRSLPGDLFRFSRSDCSVRLAADWLLPVAELAATSGQATVGFRLVAKVQPARLDVQVLFRLDFDAFAGAAYPCPVLDAYDYSFDLDLSHTTAAEVVLVDRIGFHLPESARNLYNATFLITEKDLEAADLDKYATLGFSPLALPFLVNSYDGRIVYSRPVSSASETPSSYEFSVLALFKLRRSGRLAHVAEVQVRATRSQPAPTGRVVTTNQTSLDTYTVDLSLPITSADLLENFKCPLVGFFRCSGVGQANKYKLLRPEPDSRVVKYLEMNRARTTTTTTTTTTTSRTRLKAGAGKRKNNPGRKTPKIKAVRHKSSARVRRGAFDDYADETFTLDEARGPEEYDYLSDEFRDAEETGNVGGELEQFEDEVSEFLLLNETLYSSLYLDEETGALYLNFAPTETKTAALKQRNSGGRASSIDHSASQLIRLVSFYLYERDVDEKIVRLDAASTTTGDVCSLALSLSFKRTASAASIGLYKSSSGSAEPEEPTTTTTLPFEINSDNLLNVFPHGDEFVHSIGVFESQARSAEPSPVFGLRAYLQERFDARRTNAVFMSLFNELRFYLPAASTAAPDNAYFEMSDAVNGVLAVKAGVGLDYEVKRRYEVKIMIVQRLPEERQVHAGDDDDYLPPELFASDKQTVSSGRAADRRFVYWFDLGVNVLNRPDEPFICQQPVYFTSVNENIDKDKNVLNVSLVDFDRRFLGTSSERDLIAAVVKDEARFQARIVSGNAQGLFHMSGLGLFTGSRKIDRESRAQYELDVEFRASINSTTSRRAASCKVIVQVQDINDHRPIVNVVELVIYNKLDARLIDELKVPIATTVAMDHDEVSKFTYSILSVKMRKKHRDTEPQSPSPSQSAGELADESKYLFAARRLRKRQDASSEHDTEGYHSDKELTSLFRMNASTGALYYSRTSMPCSDCVVKIQYRVTDVGRFKTRQTKSFILFHVKPLPLKLAATRNATAGGDLDELIIDDDGQSASTALLDLPKATFELVLPPANAFFNKTVPQVSAAGPGVVRMSLPEDIPLGQKIYQVLVRRREGSNTAAASSSIIFFTLLERGNVNQTFYLSNSDGSLYLTGTIDYEAGPRHYNLTVLVTNWMGQVEYLSVLIDVQDANDNRPRFRELTAHVYETIDYEGGAEGSGDERAVRLVDAVDADELDANRLSFALDDCFYLAKNVLITRPEEPMTDDADAETFDPPTPARPSRSSADYPLCSARFLRLEATPNGSDTSLVARFNRSAVLAHLANHSDLSLLLLDSRASLLVRFVLDVSVEDASGLRSKASVARVFFNLKIRLPSGRAAPSRPRRQAESAEASPTVVQGFRKSDYLVEIDSPEQLRKGAPLLAFYDEFVWRRVDNSGRQSASSAPRFSFIPSRLDKKSLDDVLNESMSFSDYYFDPARPLRLPESPSRVAEPARRPENKFPPFGVKFFLKHRSRPADVDDVLVRSLVIESNFGTVFFNRSLNARALNSSPRHAQQLAERNMLVVELDVYAKVTRELASSATQLGGAAGLSRKARLVVVVKKLALAEPGAAAVNSGRTQLADLLNRPVFVEPEGADHLDAYLFENTPAGAWLFAEPAGTWTAALFTLGAFLDRRTLAVLSGRRLRFALRNASDLFEVEPTSGFVRSRVELDYERARFHVVRVGVCLDSTEGGSERCFKQTALLRVHVLNLNDNEPKFFTGVSQASKSGVRLNTIASLDLSDERALERLGALSLFKLHVSDADDDARLVYRLINTRARVIYSSSSRNATTTTSTRGAKSVECPNYLNGLGLAAESFTLSQLTGRLLAVGLSRQGLEAVLALRQAFIAERRPETTAECYVSLELQCQVHDGLFENQATLELDLGFYEAPSTATTEVKVVRELELTEHDYSTDEIAGAGRCLVNLADELARLYSAEPTEQLALYLIDRLDFELVNYEDLFVYNNATRCLELLDRARLVEQHVDPRQFAANAYLDREANEQLYVYVNVRAPGLLDSDTSSPQALLLRKLERLLRPVTAVVRQSAQELAGLASFERVFAIRVGLSDLNDRRPRLSLVRFDQGLQRPAQLLTPSVGGQFAVNVTTRLGDLVNPMTSTPVFVVDAVDDDDASSFNRINATFVEFKLATFAHDFPFTIVNLYNSSWPAVSCHVSTSSKDAASLLGRLEKFAERVEDFNGLRRLLVRFDLLVFDGDESDRRRPRSEVKVALEVLVLSPGVPERLVFFKQSFFSFQVRVSERLNASIGRFDSFVDFYDDGRSPRPDNVFFRIVAGDQFDDFQIGVDSGELRLTNADRTTANRPLQPLAAGAYWLTVQAFEPATLRKYNHAANATVYVEVVDDLDYGQDAFEAASAPQFDRYEYALAVPENVPKLSALFTFRANSNSSVKYKLLSGFDQFYLDERTGVLYNKISFDYEEMKGMYEESALARSSTGNQLYTNAIQLVVKAFNDAARRGRSRAATTCRLTLNVTNVNDNAPKFEKAVYYSSVRIRAPAKSADPSMAADDKSEVRFVNKVSAKDVDSGDLKYSIVRQSQTVSPTAELALDDYGLFAIDAASGVVSLDSARFHLFRKDQSAATAADAGQFNIGLAVSDGIFTSFARLVVQIGLISDSTVSGDSDSTCQSLERAVFGAREKMPRLFVDYQNLSSLASRTAEPIALFDLGVLLESGSELADYRLLVNSDTTAPAEFAYLPLFQVTAGRYLSINSSSVGRLGEFVKQHAESQRLLRPSSASAAFVTLSVPVLACPVRAASSRCDQASLLVNLTALDRLYDAKKSGVSSTSPAPENAAGTAPLVAFSFRYAAVTVQQQFIIQASRSSKPVDAEPADADDQLFDDESVQEEEEFLEDENYESNERFYFEIKTLELRNRSAAGDFEFELESCRFSSFNTTYSNQTVARQIKQLLVAGNSSLLSPQQMRQLFKLNRHNGVLSSRKIINAILPGVYLFTVNLRVKVNRTSTASVGARLDRMAFKLLVLPSNNMLRMTSRYLYNHFRFDKEFYKFKVTGASADGRHGNGSWLELGKIHLGEKYRYLQSRRQGESSGPVLKYSVRYELLDNAFLSTLAGNQSEGLFELDKYSGRLRLNHAKLAGRSALVASIRSQLNEDNELVVHALAVARLESQTVNASASTDGYNDLEYMCEMHVNFASYLAADSDSTAADYDELEDGTAADNGGELVYSYSPRTQAKELSDWRRLEESKEAWRLLPTIGFSRDYHVLRVHLRELAQPCLAGARSLAIFKFLALPTSRADDYSDYLLQASSVKYELKSTSDAAGETFVREFVRLDYLNGELQLTQLARLIDETHRRSLAVYFNVSACQSGQKCVETRVKVKFINDLPLVSTSTDSATEFDFEQKNYNGTIREDALPGTVVLTILARTQAEAARTSTDAPAESELIDRDEQVGFVDSVSLDDSLTTQTHRVTTAASSGLFGLKESGGVEYFIVDGDRHNQFAISSDGKLYTRLLLDHGRANSGGLFRLTVLAFSGLTNARATATVFVQVLDVYERRPDCGSGHSSVLHLYIEENQPIGQLVAVVNATSSSSGPVRFELIASNADLDHDDLESDLETSSLVPASLPFSIGEHSGLVRVSDQLDFESRREYTFYARASLASLTAGSRHRRFSHSHRRMPYFYNNNNNNYINAVVGFNKRQKEFPSHGRRAVAAPWYSFCQVKVKVHLVDLNDNRPEFAATGIAGLEANITENAAVGTVLLRGLRAFDIDSRMNGVVRYRISNETTGLFAVDDRTGLVTLAEPGLDRERLGSRVNLTITATDLGAPQSLVSEKLNVLVNILDENDNVPVFEAPEYFVSVEENVPVGFTVKQMRAVDADLNARTEYFLLAESSSEGAGEKFKVDRATGDVIVAGELDFESRPRYELAIKAVDADSSSSSSASPSIARLVVELTDLNDNLPMFNAQTPNDVYIYENEPANTSVVTLGQYTFDSDASARHARMRFRLVDGNQLGHFELEPETGRLATTRPLDFEDARLNISLYELLVECSNEDTTANKAFSLHKLRVHVRNLNDNAPVFERQNQTLIFRATAASAGQEIARLAAHDADPYNQGGAPFSYGIVAQSRLADDGRLVELSGASESLFSVGAVNGSLVLARKPTLANQTYVVQVRCYDSGLAETEPASRLFRDTFVTVKVTDDPNREPRVNLTDLTVITLAAAHSSIDEPVRKVFDAEFRPEAGETVGRVEAADDDRDPLSFMLFRNEASMNAYTSALLLNADRPNETDLALVVDRQSGELRVRESRLSGRALAYKVVVSDGRYMVESDLRVGVLDVRSECLANALFVKFNVWSSGVDGAEPVGMDEFVSGGFVRRFKDVVARLLNNQNQASGGHGNRTALAVINGDDVLVVAARHVSLGADQRALRDASDLDLVQLEPGLSGALVELVFVVRRPLASTDDETADENESVGRCLNGKVIAKILTKRKNLIQKRMRGPVDSALRAKIVDMSFTRECFTKRRHADDNADFEQQQIVKQFSICTTNLALKNCKLRLAGAPSRTVEMCERFEEPGVQRCSVLARHEWTCEEVEPETTPLPVTTTTTPISSTTARPALKVAPTSCRKPHNPCKNNGICKQVRVASLKSNGKANSSQQQTGRIRVHCFCPNGFKGRFCEEDVDECAEFEAARLRDATTAGPCAPGALCVNTFGSFRCNCSASGGGDQAACYNALSPQFLAQDGKRVALRNYKFSAAQLGQGATVQESDELLTTLDDDQDYAEGEKSGANDDDDKVFFRNDLIGSVTNRQLRQVLFGLFGGICALLIVLSLAAAVVCRVNMSRMRRSDEYIAGIHQHQQRRGGSSSSSASCTSSAAALGSSSAPTTAPTSKTVTSSSARTSRTSSTSSNESVEQIGTGKHYRSSRRKLIRKAKAATAAAAAKKKSSAEAGFSSGFSVCSFPKRPPPECRQPATEEESSTPTAVSSSSPGGSYRFTAPAVRTQHEQQPSQKATGGFFGFFKRSRHRETIRTAIIAESEIEMHSPPPATSQPQQQDADEQTRLTLTTTAAVLKSALSNGEAETRCLLETHTELRKAATGPVDQLGFYSNTLPLKYAQTASSTTNTFKTKFVSQKKAPGPETMVMRPTGRIQATPNAYLTLQAPGSAPAAARTMVSTFQSTQKPATAVLKLDVTPVKASMAPAPASASNSLGQAAAADKETMNDSMNTTEEFGQGFYWDITDWNGGIAAIDPTGMQQLDKHHETINTNLEHVTTPTNAAANPLVASTADVSSIGLERISITAAASAVQNSTFNELPAPPPQQAAKSDDFSSMYSRVYRVKANVVQDVVVASSAADSSDDQASTLSIFDRVEGLYDIDDEDDETANRSNTIKRCPASATPVAMTTAPAADSSDTEDAGRRREPLLSPSRAVSNYLYLYKQDEHNEDN